MADDVTLKDGNAADFNVAADEIGGKKYQRVKLAVGADGVAADLAPGQTTLANSLPVAIASDQSAVPVSDGGGSLTVDGPLTDAQLRASAVPVSGTFYPATQPVSGTVTAQDGGGSLTVDDGGGSLTVDGTVAISGAVPITDNAGSLTVDGTVAATQSGTWNVGTVTAVTGITNALPAGTNAIGKLAANSGVDIGDVDVTSGPTGASAFQVQGTVAHDGAAANNPVLNAGYAINAEPAAVANGDVARLLTDLVGKLITLPYANPENFVAGKTSDITGTSDTAVIAAQGAGVRLYITHIIVTNSHATVGTFVLVKDGSTEIYNGYAAAAGGGFSLTLPVPLRLAANAALNVACATTGANVRASASGYKGV